MQVYRDCGAGENTHARARNFEETRRVRESVFRLPHNRHRHPIMALAIAKVLTTTCSLHCRSIRPVMQARKPAVSDPHESD